MLGASEVARLRAQIDAEYLAVYRGFSGLSSGSTKHEVIIARLERFGAVTASLVEQYGPAEVVPLIVSVMEQDLCMPQEGGA